MLLLCAGKATSQGFSFSAPNLPDWAKPEKNTSIGELRQSVPIWLVEVQAIKVVPDSLYNGRFNRITLKIIHVYAGVDKINNTTFEVSSIPDSHGVKVLNMKLNELAIYCVIPYEDTRVQRGEREGQVAPTILTEPTFTPLVSELRSFTGSYYGYDFPIPQSDPLFTQALAYAQSIERVAKAERNEQIRLLGAYTKSALPERSAWAVATLAQSGIEAAPKFLLDLVSDPKIPIAGQLALDQGLQQLDEAGQMQWSASSTRLDLWRRLVTAPANEDESLSIVSGIIDIARNESRKRQGAQMSKTQYTPAIAGTQMFEWLRLAANAQWTTQARARAVTAVGELAQLGEIERDAAFTYLLARAQELPEFAPDAKAQTLTADAAYQIQGPLRGLNYLRPLPDAEAAPLRKLQQRTKSSYTRDWLERLFEKTN